MTRTLKGTDFVSVRCIANDIASSASAGYWLEEYRVDAGHHRAAITREVRALAELLGMKLVPLDSAAATNAIGNLRHAEAMREEGGE